MCGYFSTGMGEKKTLLNGLLSTAHNNARRGEYDLKKWFETPTNQLEDYMKFLVNHNDALDGMEKLASADMSLDAKQRVYDELKDHLSEEQELLRYALVLFGAAPTSFETHETKTAYKLDFKHLQLAVDDDTMKFFNQQPITPASAEAAKPCEPCNSSEQKFCATCQRREVEKHLSPAVPEPSEDTIEDGVFPVSMSFVAASLFTAFPLRSSAQQWIEVANISAPPPSSNFIEGFNVSELTTADPEWWSRKGKAAEAAIQSTDSAEQTLPHSEGGEDLPQELRSEDLPQELRSVVASRHLEGMTKWHEAVKTALDATTAPTAPGKDSKKPVGLIYAAMTKMENGRQYYSKVADALANIIISAEASAQALRAKYKEELRRNLLDDAQKVLESHPHIAQMVRRKLPSLFRPRPAAFLDVPSLPCTTPSKQQKTQTDGDVLVVESPASVHDGPETRTTKIAPIEREKKAADVLDKLPYFYWESPEMAAYVMAASNKDGTLTEDQARKICRVYHGCDVEDHVAQLNAPPRALKAAAKQITAGQAVKRGRSKSTPAPPAEPRKTRHASTRTTMGAESQGTEVESQETQSQRESQGTSNPSAKAKAKGKSKGKAKGKGDATDDAKDEPKLESQQSANHDEGDAGAAPGRDEDAGNVESGDDAVNAEEAGPVTTEQWISRLVQRAKEARMTSYQGWIRTVFAKSMATEYSENPAKLFQNVKPRISAKRDAGLITAIRGDPFDFITGMGCLNFMGKT